MVFLWFSYGFPIFICVFQRFSYDVPIFPWFSHGFPMVFPWLRQGEAFGLDPGAAGCGGWSGRDAGLRRDGQIGIDIG